MIRGLLILFILTVGLALIGALGYFGFIVGVATLIDAYNASTFVGLTIAFALAKVVFSIPLMLVVAQCTFFSLFAAAIHK